MKIENCSVNIFHKFQITNYFFKSQIIFSANQIKSQIIFQTGSWAAC